MKTKDNRRLQERIDRSLLRQVANVIEKKQAWFDQSRFGDFRFGEECQTPCCVAGIIGILRGYRVNRYESISQFARKELNLHHNESRILFDESWLSLYANPKIRLMFDYRLRRPDSDEAVIVLRAIADDPEILDQVVRMAS